MQSSQIPAITTPSHEPHYFANIARALASPELIPQDRQIIYLSIGSYTYRDKHASYGYAQALPLFIENILKNEQHRDNLKIISCDMFWVKKQSDTSFQNMDYPHSDLARHLQENDLEKYAHHFYCVDRWIDSSDFEQLKHYLMSVLQKGGIVFLAEYEGPGIHVLYNQLLQECASLGIDASNRLYLLNWSMLAEQTNTNQKSKVVVDICKGNTFSEIDFALLRERASKLSYMIDLLSGNSLQRYKKYKHMIAEIEDDTNNYAPMLADSCNDEVLLQKLASEYQLYSSYLHLKNGVNFTWKIKLTEQEYDWLVQHIYDVNIKPVNYNAASLVPTKHLPLLDFNLSEKGQHLLAEQIRPNEYANFHLLDLFNKASIYSLAGVEPPAQQITATLSNSSSTLFTKPLAAISAPSAEPFPDQNMRYV